MGRKKIRIYPYVRDSRTKELFTGESICISSDSDFHFKWKIPAVPFAIDEIGLIVAQESEGRFLGKLILDQFDISGKILFSIELGDEKKEFGGLSRCSLTGGKWEVEKEGLIVELSEDSDNPFLLYSGPYYSKDYYAETELTPINGGSHLIIFRSIGAEHGYFFGFYKDNNAALFKKNHDVRLIKKVVYKWKPGMRYLLSVDIKGKKITCYINKKEFISFWDKEAYTYGMVGLAKLLPGKTIFHNLKLIEQENH